MRKRPGASWLSGPVGFGGQVADGLRGRRVEEPEDVREVDPVVSRGGVALGDAPGEPLALAAADRDAVLGCELGDAPLVAGRGGARFIALVSASVANLGAGGPGTYIPPRDLVKPS
jgi:hypothetical protein